jgi:hypothetical protein
MAYTQNINDLRILLKPGILIPTSLMFISGIAWAVYLFKILPYTYKGSIAFAIIMVLVLTAGMMSASLVINSFFEMKNRLSWPETEGEITVSMIDQSALVTRTGPSNENFGLMQQTIFTPHVSYRYFVDSKEYHVTGISGVLTEGAQNANEAEAIIKKYPIGKKVSVFYSPRHPNIAVLERASGALFSLPLIVGMLFIFGGLFFSWVITVSSFHGGKTIELYQLFEVPDQVKPVFDKGLSLLDKELNKHQKFKSHIVTAAVNIAGFFNTHKPSIKRADLSKKQMEDELVRVNDVWGGNKKLLLIHSIETYWRAHHYNEAVEKSKQLSELTITDFDENWYANQDWAHILAEADRMDDASKVFEQFKKQWGNEIEKRGILLDKELNALKHVPRGMPPKN